MKKLLALLLALIMVITLLPSVSFAEGDPTYGQDYPSWQPDWDGTIHYDYWTSSGSYSVESPPCPTSFDTHRWLEDTALQNWNSNCIQMGVNHEYCNLCGCHRTVYSKEQGHVRTSYSVCVQRVQPKCAEPGYEKYLCKYYNTCHEFVYEEIPALGHSWKKDHVEAPTATSDGAVVYRCTRRIMGCFAVYREPLAMLGGYSLPEKVSDGHGHVGSPYELGGSYMSSGGVMFTSDFWYDGSIGSETIRNYVQNDTLYLRVPEYKTADNKRNVMIVTAVGLPDPNHPYIDVNVDIQFATDVYLVNFGTRTTELDSVPRRGLRNITVRGNGVNVYLVNSNLGFIDYTENFEYVYPILNGGSSSNKVRISVGGYDNHVRMGVNVNSPIQGQVHCTADLQRHMPTWPEDGRKMIYNPVHQDNPFRMYDIADQDELWGLDYVQQPAIELANMTVEGLWSSYTGLGTNGEIYELGAAKLIHCNWTVDKLELRDFALLELEDCDLEIGTVELHNRAELTIGGSLRGKVQVYGTNTLRMDNGTLYGSVEIAGTCDDSYGLETDPNSAAYGKHYLQGEDPAYAYSGAGLDLLLDGKSFIELPTYDEYDQYDLGIMVDHDAALTVNDNPKQEGVGELSIRCEYDGFPYYPFTSIGGTKSLEPEPHGWVCMESGILNLRGYNGGAALGGSAMEPDEYWEYLGEVGDIPEPELGDYIRIEDSDGSYYGVVPTPGYCVNGGSLLATGGVINAEAEYGGAAIGGARYGDGGVITIWHGSVNARTSGGAAAIGGGLPLFEDRYVLAGYQLLRLDESFAFLRPDENGQPVYLETVTYNGREFVAGTPYQESDGVLNPYGLSAIYKKMQTYVSGGGSGRLTIEGGSAVTAWADNPLYDQQNRPVDWERLCYHPLCGEQTEREAYDPSILYLYDLRYYQSDYEYFREVGFTNNYFALENSGQGAPVVETRPLNELMLPNQNIDYYGYQNGRSPGYILGSSCENAKYNSDNQVWINGVNGVYSTLILGQNASNQYNLYDNPTQESTWDHYYMKDSGDGYLVDDDGHAWTPSRVFDDSCVILRIGYHWEGTWEQTDFEGYQIRHNLQPKAYTIQGDLNLPSVDGGMDFNLPRGTTLTLRSGSVLNVGEGTSIYEDPQDEGQLVIEEGAIVRGDGLWPGKPLDPENPPTTQQIRSLLERIENPGGQSGTGSEETCVVTHLGIIKTNGGKLVLSGNSADEIRQKLSALGLTEQYLINVLNAGHAGFKREISADGDVITWSLNLYGPDTVVSLLENGALVASPGPYSLADDHFDVVLTERDDDVSVKLKSPILSTPAYAVFEGAAGEELELLLEDTTSATPFRVELTQEQVNNNKCVFSIPKFADSELSINTIAPLRNKCAVRFAGKMNFNLLVSEVAGVHIDQLQLNYNEEHEQSLGGIDGGGSVGILDIGGFPVNGSAEMNINTFSPNKTFSLDVSLETPIFSGAFRGSIKEALGTMVVDSLYAEMAVGKGGIPLVPPTVVGYLQGGGLGFSGLAETLEKDGGIAPLRFEISAKASILDAVSGWARASVGPNGFDLKLTDIKVADYNWIKEFGASALMEMQERTIDGIKYWGINTDFNTYLVVGVPLKSLGYDPPEDNENASGLNAEGRVGIGCFAGYKKVSESDGTYLYFVYQLRASGSLDGSLVIPKHIVGGILPSKDITVGSVGVGFYAEANASTKLNATEVADTGSPKNLLGQLSKNADLKFHAAIGAKASVSLGVFDVYVRAVYVLGQNNFNFSYGKGDGGEWDLSGYLGSKAVSTSGYDTSLAVVGRDGEKGPIPAIVQTGVSTVATLGSEPVRGAEDMISMVLNPDGSVSVTVNQALAGNVLISLTLDQLVENLSAANVSVNNGAVALIPDVLDENGISTVPNANFCVSGAMNGENEVSAICFVPSAAGTYTFALHNTSAVFASGQAMVSAEFASFDPATQLGVNSLSYSVNDAAENGRYKVQVFLGETEGQGDYLLAETDELTPETLSGVLNASFSGNLAPGGSYYPSILLLEYVDATDEAGQTVGSWAAIDQINLSEIRTYTNSDEIPAPTGVTLAYAGNGGMAAAWNAVSGAGSYQISVYQEVSNTAWDEDAQAMVPVEGTHFEDTGLSFETADTSILMNLSSLYGDPAESRNLTVGVRAVKNTAATIQSGSQEIEDPESEDQYKTGREGLSAAAELVRPVPVTVTYSDNVKGEAGSRSVAASFNGASFTVNASGEDPLNITVTGNLTDAPLASANGVTSLEVPVPAPTEELTAGVLTLEVRAEDPVTGDYALDRVTVNYDVTQPPLILDDLGRYPKWSTDYGFHAEITGHTEAGAEVRVYSMEAEDWDEDYQYIFVTSVTAGEDGSFSVPANFDDMPLYCVQAVDAAGNQSPALMVEFRESEVLVNLDPNGGSCVVYSIGMNEGMAIGKLPRPENNLAEKEVFDCWYLKVENSIETEYDGVFELNITEVPVTQDMVVAGTDDGRTGLYHADGTLVAAFDTDPVLYARWADGVVLTYAPGEDAACDVDQRLYIPGSELGELPVPRRTDGADKLFLGWFYGETRYTETSVITVDTILDAHWADPARITFDADLGNLDLSMAESGLTAGWLDGSSLVIPSGSAIANYPTASATGYSFEGWFNGDTAVQSGDVYSEDVTLTAHWSRITAPLAVSQAGCVVGEILPDPVYTTPADMVGDPIITYYQYVPYVDINGETLIKTYTRTAKPTEAGYYTVQVECGTFEKAYVGSAEFNIVGVLDDGFYLIGPDWSLAAIDADQVFAPNPAVQGEFMLTTTLVEDQKVKVVKVQNGAITVWYPDGVGNEYTVDAAHAGEKTIYFRESYNGDWAAFGGFFWIEANAGTPTEPIETSDLHVYSSISVGNDMVVTFSARKNDLANYEKFWIEVVKHDPEGDVIYRYGEDQEGALSDLNPDGSTGATWKAQFKHLFAKEMGIDVDARLCAEDANGQVYRSPVRSVNLRDYLGERLTATNNKVQQRTLAADLLNYGAAAQLFMNFQTDHLVNRELTAAQLAKLGQYQTSGLPPVSKTNYNTRPQGTSNILFDSVTLGNEVLLNLTVRLPESTEGVQVLVKDHETGAVVTPLDTTFSGSTFSAVFSGIGADKMRTEFDLVTLVNGVETGNIRTWSVEGYVAEIRSGTNQTKTNLANALLAYGDSAAAYFAAQ